MRGARNNFLVVGVVLLLCFMPVVSAGLFDWFTGTGKVVTGEKCVDSDGGKNLLVPGLAQVGKSGISDYCGFFEGEGKIYESYCINDTAYGKDLLDCPKDKPYCNAGACSDVKAECTDSDDGLNKFVLGITITNKFQEPNSHSDYCESLSTNSPLNPCSGEDCGIREFACYDGIPSSYGNDIPCPNGCVDGACVKKVVDSKEKVQCEYLKKIDGYTFYSCNNGEYVNNAFKITFDKKDAQFYSPQFVSFKKVGSISTYRESGKGTGHWFRVKLTEIDENNRAIVGLSKVMATSGTTSFDQIPSCEVTKKDEEKRIYTCLSGEYINGYKTLIIGEKIVFTYKSRFVDLSSGWLEEGNIWEMDKGYDGRVDTIKILEMNSGSDGLIGRVKFSIEENIKAAEDECKIIGSNEDGFLRCLEGQTSKPFDVLEIRDTYVNIKSSADIQYQLSIGEIKPIDVKYGSGTIKRIMITLDAINIVSGKFVADISLVKEKKSGECKIIGSNEDGFLRCLEGQTSKPFDVLEIRDTYVNIKSSADIQYQLSIGEIKPIDVKYGSGTIKRIMITLDAINIVSGKFVADISLVKEKEKVKDDVFITRALTNIKINNQNGICEEFVSDEIMNKGDKVSFVVNGKNINIENLGLKSFYNDDRNENQEITVYSINGKQTNPWEHFSQFPNIIRAIVYGDDYYEENRDQSNSMTINIRNIGSIDEPKAVVYYSEEDTIDCGSKGVGKNNEPQDLSCDACTVDGSCVSVGYRFDYKYCSISGIKDQFGENVVCDNNFECSSNLCIDSACVEAGLWKKIMNWFSRIF